MRLENAAETVANTLPSKAGFDPSILLAILAEFLQSLLEDCEFSAHRVARRMKRPGWFGRLRARRYAAAACRLYGVEVDAEEIVEAACAAAESEDEESLIELVLDVRANAWK